MKQNHPTGVKAISILNYVCAVFGVLIGFVMLIWGSMFIFNNDSGIVEGATASDNFFGFLMEFGFSAFLIGLILLGVSFLLLFLGIHLWDGRNWARMLQIVLMSIFIIFYIVSFLQGGKIGFLEVVQMIPALIIIFYLIFDKQVKKYFVDVDYLSYGV
jgi:hypothetical protein